MLSLGNSVRRACSHGVSSLGERIHPNQCNKVVLGTRLRLNRRGPERSALPSIIGAAARSRGRDAGTRENPP